MTILDDLAALARERHFGHESVLVSERVLCRVTRIPTDWCHGCRKGLHKHTRQPLIGSEPDYCPKCTPLGYGSCRCQIASNE